MVKNKLWISLIVLFGLIIRLSTALVGYHGDLNNNISWGRVAYEDGLNGFYGSNNSDDWEYSAPNQPPLTIITFAFMAGVWQKLRDFFWYMNWELLIFPSRLVWFWDDHGMTLLVKLPSIIADLGLGLLIYNFVLKKLKKSEKMALLALAIWVFNPIVWYNSAVWGQTDGVVNLLGLFAIAKLVGRKLVSFAVFFTLSFLFKGSLGTLIPVLFFFALFQKYQLKEWIRAGILSFLAVVLVSVWFHPQIDLPIWLYDLYVNRILPGEIGFLTANSFNFWWLVDSGKVYDHIKYFGLTARVWGIAFTLVVNAISIIWLGIKSNTKRLIVSLVIVSLASFLFMTRIHERYLYPFFPVSTIYSVINPAYFVVYTLYSLIHLLNLYNLFWVPGITWLENLLTIQWITNILAVGNILLFFITLRNLKRTNM